MKIHIGRKHKEIPQLDGEIQTERDTDDWWENNSAVSLKTLKVYKDVIEDIKIGDEILVTYTLYKVEDINKLSIISQFMQED